MRPLGWLRRFAPLSSESRDDLIGGTGLLRGRHRHVLPQGSLGSWAHDSVDRSGIVSGFREGFLQFADVLRLRRTHAAHLDGFVLWAQLVSIGTAASRVDDSIRIPAPATWLQRMVMYLLAPAGCIANASGPGSSCAPFQPYRHTAWRDGDRQRCQRLSPPRRRWIDSVLRRPVTKWTGVDVPVSVEPSVYQRDQPHPVQTVREVLTTVIETLVGCRQGKDEGAGCVSTPRLKWWTILDLNQ